MASTKQRRAARRNIRKAQARWKSMTPRQRAIAQPQGRGRKKPGTTGHGNFYRVVVRPKSEFSSFRIQKVGLAGHSERLAGHRAGGGWDTQAWLISKKDARRIGNRLDALDAKLRRNLKKMLSGPILHVEGDIFRAKPRRDIPESQKPTPAMRRAQRRNIRKAQVKWRHMHQRAA